ncbi:MAG TPA: DNA polymerase [Terriglobia bacterium]|nr:DNA polymerase [Terriglobia bacterium]
MRVLDSATLQPERLSAQEQLWAYNGLDTAITSEALSKLKAQYNREPFAYVMSRAMQGPSFTLSNRGVRIDDFQRQEALKDIQADKEKFERIFKRLTVEGLGLEINYRSPLQLQKLFFQILGLKPTTKYDRNTKKSVVTTGREALEKLQKEGKAKPFADLILALRDLDKKKSVLETNIENSRMYCSYHVAGTLTGRWSSSSDVFGRGMNLQNITKKLRRMFIPDPGMKLAYVDLQQAESVITSMLALPWGDRYYRAVKSGDVHTYVTRAVWNKELPWTGDPKKDKALADGTKFYRQHSYRDMGKRGGHACVTGDHEVLTRGGWVKISEMPSEILTWSEQGSNFAPVQHWHSSQYKGKMLRLEGRALSITMTPNHRVYYVQRTANPKSKVKEKLFVKTAAELQDSGLIPLGNNYVGGNISVSVWFARMAAAVQADGHIKTTNRTEFHLRKDRKVERLRMLAEKCGVFLEEKPEQEKYFLHTTKFPKYAGPYLLTWTREALEAYTDEHKYWDGYIAKTAVSVASADRRHLEWIQTVGRLVGIGGNIQKGQVSEYGTVCYSLQQNNRQYANIANLEQKCWIQADEQVYCPTVESGAFFIRKDGKISVTGNSNYGVTPLMLSINLKIPIGVAEAFAARYYEEFPEIKQWHNHIKQQLASTRRITTPFGRTCHFPGRHWDNDTIKSAIAYGPQSTIGDLLNLGFYRVWQKYDRIFDSRRKVEFLLQVHDAVVFQYPADEEQELIPQILNDLVVPIEINGRECVVGCDAEVGFNWDSYNEFTNPHGLIKFNPSKPDTRSEPSTLDRLLRGGNAEP